MIARSDHVRVKSWPSPDEESRGSPDVLVNVIDGESVLLNLKSESYFGLDEVGTRMWQVLSESDRSRPPTKPCSAKYDVEPEQLERDLENLIEQLREHGLVETTDG